ncbi:MAG: hypothetical protein U9Q94_03895 [Candidatus Bipolaricaulota bacterium]|nr:hypothetical protein [Candidatus Bipolaricaulota bacterium]
MGEIIVSRDEHNRILGLTGQGIDSDTPTGDAALRFLQASVSAMIDYLHLAPDYALVGSEMHLSIDRSAPHLNREIDAIMETLVIGLTQLAVEDAQDLVVHEATAGIRV